MIQKISYDPKTKYLEVKTEAGVKLYGNVDLPAVDAFRAAESPEFHYGKYIKPVYKEVVSAGN